MTDIKKHINTYFADLLTPENAALLMIDHQTGLSQAGCKTTNWVSIAAELQNDWRNPTGQDLSILFNDHLTFYGHLITNLSSQAKE